MATMDRLEFTLLTDGSSDAILIYPLEWILRQHCKAAVTGTWADLRRLQKPPKNLHKGDHRGSRCGA